MSSASRSSVSRSSASVSNLPVKASKAVVIGLNRASESSTKASRKGVIGLSQTSESSTEVSRAGAAALEAKFKSTGQSAEVIQVKNKLKKHPDYKDADESKLLKEADQIIDKEYLQEQFEHLLSDSYDLITGAIIDDQDLPPGSGNPMEELAKQGRSKLRLEDMCDLPIKLYLRDLPHGDRVSSLTCGLSSFLGLRFGPLHAALKVGDMLLEWDTSSLVLPRSQKDLAREEREFVFMADIRHSSKTHPSKTHPPVFSPTDDREIEVLISKNHDKVELINKLIEIIILYNRRFYYNVVSRNCQSFVLDAAQALGIKDQLHFRDHRLKNHFVELKTKGKAKGLQQSFLNHSELDMYISARDKRGDLEKDDILSLEYFNAVFVSFHYKDKELTKCEVPGCQQSRVHELFSKKLKQITPSEIEAFTRNEDLAVSI